MYPSDQLLPMKERMLNKVINKEMKLQELAEHFGVTRQSASKWLAKFKHGGIAELIPKKSGPKSGTTWNRTKEDIEDRVVAIAKEHIFKGPIWIADQLAIEGITVDQSTVYRILKRKKIRYYRNYKHKRRKKKLYCLDTPGREVQIDCCFPWGYQKKAIVFDAIDDCSRWVFGRVYTDHTHQSTIAFLQSLIEHVPFAISAIRTDQGSEFINKEVKKWLEGHNITHKINPPYTPQHNGKIERFHQTLKNDSVLYNWSFHDDIETLNLKLSLFLQYYNYKRKHTGLGMNRLTPAQKIAYVIISNSLSSDVNLTLQQDNSRQIKK
jgi:transposase InsO family protein